MIPRENLHDLIELRSDMVTREIVDVIDGIERVMGNRELYGRMLRRFRSDYQDGALAIRSALAEKNAELAHRLVHTLKGAAGMIGARRLLALATELEETLRLHGAGERETLASLITEFDKVLHLLDVLLEGRAPPGMAVQVPQRALLADAALLERLLDLLSKQDGEAMDLLQESQASLRVILGEAALERVTVAMQEFDFEKALAALGETAYGAGI